MTDRLLGTFGTFLCLSIEGLNAAVLGTAAASSTTGKVSLSGEWVTRAAATEEYLKD